ncbi:hypothetical protein VTI74DRAFT_2908 [Chaetomium olivicolor]
MQGHTKTSSACMGSQKESLSGRSPAVHLTAEQLAFFQKPVPGKEILWPPHDPRNPTWDASQYFVTYMNKYKCPHERCPKSFTSVSAIRAHLLSPQHANLLKVQCPTCCKWFDSVAAITQHAESQSVHCNLRNTEGYRQFLDQLTAGIVDTTEKNEDGMPVYTVPKEARRVFGTGQGKPLGQANKNDQSKNQQGVKTEEESLPPQIPDGFR